MDEILAKANELGLLIQRTEAARVFHEMSTRVERDRESSLLLEKYNELAETLRIKQESGYIIENFEAEQFARLSESVMSDDLLREYISARDRYMDMLVKINEQLLI